VRVRFWKLENTTTCITVALELPVFEWWNVGGLDYEGLQTGTNVEMSNIEAVRWSSIVERSVESDKTSSAVFPKAKERNSNLRHIDCHHLDIH
jgi:hypothetical protein